MKIAIITDQHFGARNDSAVFHQFFSKFYEQTFFPYIDKHNITTIIDMGDTFDRRKYINFNTYKTSAEMYFDKVYDRNIELHTIVGNHTSYYKNTLKTNSPMLLLSSYNNIKIYDSPTIMTTDDGTDISFFPWICDDNETRSFELINNAQTEYAFGHFQIGNIEYTPGMRSTGLDYKLFHKFKKVFSGHYHHRSILHNIEYVGNPYEITWADYNSIRGFSIFDTDTGNMEFIRNPFSIFYKFYYNDDDKENKEKMVKFIHEYDHSQLENAYVKLIVDTKNDVTLFDEYYNKINDSGISQLSITNKMYDINIVSENSITDISVGDTIDMIKNRIYSSTFVEKDELMNEMVLLYNEAVNLEVI